ncbi:FAD-dependent oxidoreductase [Desulfobulbus sp. US1]|uniref:Ferredoxin-NADP reductase n=1 Tax=Candidatus Electrothrix communis TaxID=1859133 RepID=A0A3S3QTT0_9BACT|nr:FAD-dependent oxidoreductase [Desulfobulbus sp. US4]MCW5209346.1 FAD-dependent oxidoreductase [Desulfobulbus sp. US1]RWX47576.1 Ferredoxin-NADP reductase [Candidatus Electrothrix communis]WLE99021.1 MAG: FAD-dependent oxidoreductase [Candidatus Electrothrix communis]
METTVRFIERMPRTSQVNSYRFTRPPGFSFQAGQYVIVGLGHEGMLVHPLSFSNGPQQDFLEVTKRMTGSAYSQYIEGLYPGDEVIMKGPNGDFSMADISNDIVCLAGGIGIAPIRSMLVDSASRHDRRRITLIYGNSDDDDVPFAEELEELQKMHLPGFRVTHVLGRSLGKMQACQGRIDSKVIRSEVTADLQEATFLISGPPVMVREMEEQLALLGVSSSRIRVERFLGYT